MDSNCDLNQRLTAADVMTCDVITVRDRMPAADAAQLLISKSVCGAPVVDEQGHCVGVFSAVDFSRVSQSLPDLKAANEICPYQLHHRRVDGCDVTLCTLPAGQCPLQRPDREEGHALNTCQFPHEIVVEWQPFEPKLSPKDPVIRWMSAVPITVNSRTSITECAARMEKAHIHSLVVVDDDEHIVGILNTLWGVKAVTDLNHQQQSSGGDES